MNEERAVIGHQMAEQQILQRIFERIARTGVRRADGVHQDEPRRARRVQGQHTIGGEGTLVLAEADEPTATVSIETRHAACLKGELPASAHRRTPVHAQRDLSETCRGKKFMVAGVQSPSGGIELPDERHAHRADLERKFFRRCLVQT